MSLNTVSVRLTLEFGPAAVVRDRAPARHRLASSSRTPSIALGTSEVSLLELVGAYAPFANGGIAVAPHVVERVRTRRRQVLYERRRRTAGAHHRAALRRDDERDDAGDAAHAAPRARRELPGWPAAGKTGTIAGFPRRLVRRLHRPSGRRRLARQRRQLADPQGHRRRAAGRDLEPVHAAAHQGVPVAALPGPSAADHSAAGCSAHSDGRRRPCPTPRGRCAQCPPPAAASTTG